MVPVQLLGLLSALASAVVWGTGDFAGGHASRRNHPLFVLMLGSLSGLAVFSVAALVIGQPASTTSDLLWAALAGLAGGAGLTFFYEALSTGPAALVAPSAAVVGAAVPVVVSLLREGLPVPGQLVGLLLGLAGIWLVSSVPGGRREASPRSLRLALLAGLGFGGFFVLIAQVERGTILVPMAVTRVVEFGLAACLFLIRRHSLPPQPIRALPFVTGVLDAGGNVFYLLAIQYIRLDVAAVVSSMYPGTTVLLARAIQHERTSRLQGLGIVVCLAAVALIAIS